MRKIISQGRFFFYLNKNNNKLKIFFFSFQRKLAEEKKMIEDIAEQDKPGEIVKVTNEKSSVEHVYDTKTMRDQFGNFPVWMNRRHTKKKIKHRATARLKRFNPFWCHSHVPIG